MSGADVRLPFLFVSPLENRLDKGKKRKVRNAGGEGTTVSVWQCEVKE